MRFLAKLIVLFLCLFGTVSVISYFFGFSVTFPFLISEDRIIPEHRLHAISLATFTTFVYFGICYLFFTSIKLHPIQFLTVFLFNLGSVGGLCFYVNKVELSEYYQVPLWIITSLILYNAAKPEFRSYFKHK